MLFFWISLGVIAFFLIVAVIITLVDRADRNSDKKLLATREMLIGSVAGEGPVKMDKSVISKKDDDWQKNVGVATAEKMSKLGNRPVGSSGFTGDVADKVNGITLGARFGVIKKKISASTLMK